LRYYPGVTYDDIRTGATAAERRYERPRLLKALKTAAWHPGAAAMELEVSKSTLYRALDRHPDLKKMLDENSPGRGRPRKSR